MSKRGLEIWNMFFLCGKHGEGGVDIFQHSEFVTDVCAHLNMSGFPHLFVCTKDLLEYVASACDEELLYRWLVSIWDVWHQRNKALQGEAIRQPREVIEFVVEYLAKTSRAAALVNAKICIEYITLC
ncbi:hypothetical protein LIER_43926 [Lithospermum erythrorhizon]|uniref:Uncharacterized protein n=1 Tax=Lithospermum erythrorhizon TaxID=34254 RepID=A0AAV3RB86_LITER